MKPHHLAVVVADLARAEVFYAGVLGLPVLRRWDGPDGPRSIWLGLGEGAFLAVEKGAGGQGRDDGGPGWHCVALAIAAGERDGWRERLAAHGVTIERESDYTLYFRDPDGALVALSHWPER